MAFMEKAIYPAGDARFPRKFRSGAASVWFLLEKQINTTQKGAYKYGGCKDLAGHFTHYLYAHDPAENNKGQHHAVDL